MEWLDPFIQEIEEVRERANIAFKKYEKELPYPPKTKVRFFDGLSWRPGVVIRRTLSLCRNPQVEWYIRRIRLRDGIPNGWTRAYTAEQIKPL